MHGGKRERETPIIRSSIKNCNGCNGHGMHNRELTLKGIERAVTAGMSDLFPFVLYYPTTPTDFVLIGKIRALALFAILHQILHGVYTRVS